jgi:hypothetical protein
MVSCETRLPSSSGCSCISQPAICCGDHLRISLADIAPLMHFQCTAGQWAEIAIACQLALLRAMRAAPGCCVRWRCTMVFEAAVAPDLTADCRRRSLQGSHDGPQGHLCSQTSRYLFAVDQGQSEPRPNAVRWANAAGARKQRIDRRGPAIKPTPN